MEELKQRVETEDHGHPLAAQEAGEGAVIARAERVAEPEHAGRHLRRAPERGGRVEVSGDEIGQLREAIELEGRLVLLVKERRVRAGPVKGVPSDEDAVLDAVLARVLEHGARPAQVDLVALLAGDDERGDRRHVDHRLGASLPEHVFGGPLADVDLVELDRRVEPRPPIEPDDLVPVALQTKRDLSRDRPRGARDEDPHELPDARRGGSPRRRRAPQSSMVAMTSLTLST